MSKLTSIDRIEIGRRAVAGESVEELMEEFGVSKSNLYWIRKNYLDGKYSVKPTDGSIISVSSEKLKEDRQKDVAQGAYIAKLERMVCKLTFELQELKGK